MVLIKRFIAFGCRSLHTVGCYTNRILSIIGVRIGKIGLFVDDIGCSGREDEIYTRGSLNHNLTCLISHRAPIGTRLDTEGVWQLVVVEFGSIQEFIFPHCPLSDSVGIRQIGPCKVLLPLFIGLIAHHKRLVGIRYKVAATVGDTLILDSDMTGGILQVQVTIKRLAICIVQSRPYIPLAHRCKGTEAERILITAVYEGAAKVYLC